MADRPERVNVGPVVLPAVTYPGDSPEWYALCKVRKPVSKPPAVPKRAPVPKPAAVPQRQRTWKRKLKPDPPLSPEQRELAFWATDLEPPRIHYDRNSTFYEGTHVLKRSDYQYHGAIMAEKA